MNSNDLLRKESRAPGTDGVGETARNHPSGATKSRRATPAQLPASTPKPAQVIEAKPGATGRIELPPVAPPRVADTDSERSTSERTPDPILAELRRRLGDEPCRRYFGRMASISLEGNAFRLTVPSRFLAGQIERRFGSTLREVLGSPPDSGPALELDIRVDRDAFESAKVGPVEVEPQAPEPAGEPRIFRSPRGPRFAFDTFIVGPENRLAHSAAFNVARGDERLSPLFIHGMCGLGKTHLLQSVANRYRREHPGAQVRCLTAESFTNDYITATRTGTLEQFRARYRGVDLLCIDDVHFLAGKNATQSELLHTFDAIGMQGRLVALASDEHPRAITKLSAALVSRFMSGAVVKLDAPGEALRLELLSAFADRRGLSLEPAAVQMLSDRAARNAGADGPSVRDLEGLITQIAAAYRLLPELADGAGEGGRIGVSLVTRALGMTESSASGGPHRPMRMQAVIERCCAALGVGHDEFVGRGRHKRVVLTRALTVLLARELTNHSYPEIARAMGRPNHSTVITAYKRIQQQIDTAERVSLGPDQPDIDVRELAARIRRELTEVAGK